MQALRRLFSSLFGAFLILLSLGVAGQAQDVVLTSRDGAIELSGTLLGFNGEFYRVDTVYGELTVDGSGVTWLPQPYRLYRPDPPVRRP